MHVSFLFYDNLTFESCRIVENLEVADYVQVGDIGFKKPKVSFNPWNLCNHHSNFLFPQTKKKRPSRRVAEDPDLPPVNGEDANAMEVDQKPVMPMQRDLDANFVDDDELQAALARTRRSKIKTKKVSPEEIARKGQSVLLLVFSRYTCLTKCVVYSGGRESTC